ncbi:MAG TPA: lipoprotein, partial [Burkholderiaceae bacterium]
MEGSRTSSLAAARAGRSRSTPARGAALLAAALLALLAACGQKGPLFLPPPERAASAPAP